MKKTAWWKNPQTLVSCLVGLGAIGGWIISQFVADARQQSKIESIEEQVEEIDQQVEEHETDLNKSETQQEVIQRDLEYIKESQKTLLDELRRRR